MNKPSILIIEDETLIAMELQQKVSSWGYECSFTACTSEEAVKWAFNNSPDLILADLFLKCGNSINTIESIRELCKEKYRSNKTKREYCEIPVIFLSGCVDDKIIKLTMDLNPYCILNKPLNYPKLKFTIEMALKPE